MVNRTGIYYFQFRESYTFLVPGSSRNPRYHHQLHQFLAFYSEFFPLCFFESVFGGGNVLLGKGLQEL